MAFATAVQANTLRDLPRLIYEPFMEQLAGELPTGAVAAPTVKEWGDIGG